MGGYSYGSSLQVALDEDGVLLATLNRPRKKNAFDGELRHGLRDLFQRAGRDVEVRCFVLTGAGGAFSSGADLTAEDRRPWPTSAAEPAFAWCLDLLQMPKPTIAAIDGVAAGGGLGLSLLCDIRICTDRARLIPLWLKRAIHPDDLVTWTLPRLVGYSRALTWLYLADDIPLDECLQCGLVQEICSAGDLQGKASGLATRLARSPTTHLALAKQAVLKGLNEDPFGAAMLESWGQDRARDTEDNKEGVRAFREKTTPDFKGH